jgi:hypothetical protein
MNKIEEFINSKETFNKVLNILSEKGDLSKVNQEDYIAGGSVANTLLYLLHGGNLVINDIDVYKMVPTPKEFYGTTNWYSNLYISPEGLEIINDNYGHFFVSDTGSRMKVTGHSRDGIFNNIAYIYEHNNKTTKPKECIIIEGFDLNCCQAGLDLINEKIIYTPEFVSFLKTKQMKVVNPCAPLQTTIRIYKKLKELNIYCNIEHEMRFLTLSRNKLSNHYINICVGVETMLKYDKCKNFVEKYFILREKNDNDYLPSNLKDKKIDLWVYDSVLDFDIVEDFHSIANLRRIWELLYSPKKKSEQDKINKIFYKNVFLGDLSEDIWTRRHYDCDKKSYVELPYYNTYRMTAHMILTEKDYYKCDFNIKHVDYLDKFFKEHPLTTKILKHVKTLSQQYKIVKFIKSLVNKEGQWVIGSLESFNYKIFMEELEKNNHMVTNELIETIIKKDREYCSQPLIEKLSLKGFEYKNCVRELNTKMELREEGQKMGHCVGGYADSISSEYSRIFHIECDGIGSTVQIEPPKKTFYNNVTYTYEKPISITRDVVYPDFCMLEFEKGPPKKESIKFLKFRITQHYGRYPEKGNLEPTKINQEIVKKLIDFLNEKYLTLNFANKEEIGIFV